MKHKSLLLLLKNCEALVNIKQVHAQALTQGLLLQPLACKLFNCYIKLGNPHDAQKTFDKIRDPDIVAYTSLIGFYLRSQLPGKALTLFSRFVDSGLRPDSHLVVAALSACGRNRVLVSGKAVHGMVYRFQLGLKLNPIVGNALIDMYCRNGQIEVAKLVFEHMETKDVSSWTSLFNGFVLSNDLESSRRVFDEMPQRNIVAWNAMISGYVRGGMPVQALEIFKRMRAEGECQPIAVTVVALLSGSADVGALDHGQAIHGFISKSYPSKDVIVNNALMDMYSKSGRLESAVKIFNEILNKDAFSWTTMISGYAFHGKGNSALEVFYDMLESRVRPTDVTFLSVLSACSHAGLVNEAQRLFETMIHCHGFKPKVEHYGCMVDLLGRAGRLEEAKELVDKMPINPDAVVWRSLLAACIFHGNLQLAEMVGKKIIELQVNDDGVYVLLGNMYFSLNRREDALKMRRMIRDQKVKKKPAGSWIEVDGVVHSFVSKNRFHHASTDHLMLDLEFCPPD